MESAGLPFDESLVIHTGIHAGGSADRPGKGDGNAVDGYKAARVLFRRHPHLSLLFCDTDRMAMGAYDYLKETGRRIPHDAAVVGFDNQWLVATQIRPTLTTIAFRDIGAGDPGVAQDAADSGIPGRTERRGQQIVRELQARALAERGYALNPDELATTLGATTTLPGDVIARLARADSQDRVAWGAVLNSAGPEKGHHHGLSRQPDAVKNLGHSGF